MRRIGALLVVALIAAAPAVGDVYIHVDQDGATQLTDDPSAVPTDLPGAGTAAQRGTREIGPEPRSESGKQARSERSDAQRRSDRILQGAIEDLRRGESARAATAFESVLESDPRNAIAHWYLADLDRKRGRLESAAEHLDAFLAHAGDDQESWRRAAERRRRSLADEARLASGAGSLRLVAAESPHFLMQYDARLGETSPDYARTVLGYLDEAHRSVTSRIGVAPRERTGVVLYAKAAYLAAHRHRFSFPTVGFFDGQIHVASAAHPEGELRSLLFHEYTHAVFAERTGGDKPFWLNEGLAELSERSGWGEVERSEAGKRARAERSLAMLTRSERAALHRNSVDGEWISLARLADGFGGLDEAEARAAYLEATAAAAWVEARAGARGIAALLDALGAGQAVDRALVRAVGTDTAGIETALRASIDAEFPGP